MRQTLEDFVGKWAEDSANSDSIEPMLKAMGVRWNLRKIVGMMRMVQQIEVVGDKLIVSNIRSKKSESITHVVNGGKRVIETSRGEQVIDDCKFDQDQEFPLEICAVLPQNKGGTIDRRKLIGDGSQLVQSLTYQFPEPTDGSKRAADLHMKRTFVRLRDDESSSASETTKSFILDEEKSDSPILENFSREILLDQYSDDEAEKITPPVSDDKTSPATPPSASVELWLTGSFMFMFATSIFPEEKSVQNVVFLLLIGGVFAASRAMARTEKGADFVKESPLVLFYLSLFFGFVSAYFFRDNFILLLVAGLYFAVSRVHALPLLKDSADDMILPLIGTLAVATLASTVFLEGPVRHFSVCGLVAFVATIAYEILLLKFSASRDDLSESKDTDGSTLSVSVNNYRLADGNYTQYRMQVTYEGFTWYVWRRFSQFDSLRHELRRLFGAGVLPKLPPKTWVTSVDTEFVEGRMASLNTFINELLSSDLRSQVFNVAEMKNFLGVGQGRGVPTASLKLNEEKSLVATSEESKELCEVLSNANSILCKALSVGEGDGWKFLQKVSGIQCYIKEENGLTYTKGVGTVPYPPGVVAAFLSDESKRSMYDDLFLRQTVLKTIDTKDVAKVFEGDHIDGSFCMRLEYKSPVPMAVGPRDVVVALARTIQSDGSVKVVLSSVNDRFYKPRPNLVRARVICGGYVIKPHPMEKDHSILSNVQMMDLNGNIPRWIIKKLAPERASIANKISSSIGKLPTLPTPLTLPKTKIA